MSPIENFSKKMQALTLGTKTKWFLVLVKLLLTHVGFPFQKDREKCYLILIRFV